MEDFNLDPRNYVLSVKNRNVPAWDKYKVMQACFWTNEEIDLASDRYGDLTSDEQHYINMILAFFAASDGIVNENISTNLIDFFKDKGEPEILLTYNFQQMMEGIHSEVYSSLIEEYIKDEGKKYKLFNALKYFSSIRNKALWAKKWIHTKTSILDQLIAFVCVEGVFFSGSFCAIFWLKKRGLMPGLTFSNELISRDEGLHTEFAIYVYEYLCGNKEKYNFDRFSEEKIHQIFSDAVKVECEFVSESLPVRLIGMNEDSMCQYIKFVADTIVDKLGYRKIYNVRNPFDWMDLISLQGKTNFFEKRVGEYSKAGIGVDPTKQVFSLDADF